MLKDLMKPKMQDHPFIGVDAIIFNDGYDKVLLMRRTGKSFNGMWGLISGMVEWNETIHEAIKREAFEEVGVRIKIKRYTGKYYDKIGRHPTKTVICLPHICSIESGDPYPKSECDSVRWFKANELKDIELAYDHKEMLKDVGFLK